MAALATLELAIPVPAGLDHGIQTADPEPSDNFQTFPAFLNVEQDQLVTDPQIRAMGHDQAAFIFNINAYLLLGTIADRKYSIRERRLWTDACIEAFEDDVTLASACIGLFVVKATFGVISVGQVEYFGTTFALRVFVDR